MKTIRFSIVAAIVILSSFTLSAAAQNRVLGRADIPFSFAAHDQSFGAGAYELRQIGAQIVRLQEVTTARGVTLISPQAIGEDSTTKIVFRCYGTREFLAAVVAPSYQISVAKSRAEQEAEATTAKVRTVALQAQR
jgi:hypothetical protein